MQQVITESQARKITGGRKPLVPVEYEDACRALVACQSLDEAKYWGNKADALAAWAKIYHDDEALRDARALKLWAHRRMGQLAEELRPVQKKGKGNGRGFLPGPRTLLKEHGLSGSAISGARRLAFATEEEVAALANLPRPPAPSRVSSDFTRMLSKDEKHRGGIPRSEHPSWTTVVAALGAVNRLLGLDAAAIGASVLPENSAVERKRAIALIEWLDKFEQHLPKK